MRNRLIKNVCCGAVVILLTLGITITTVFAGNKLSSDYQSCDGGENGHPQTDMIGQEGQPGNFGNGENPPAEPPSGADSMSSEGTNPPAKPDFNQGSPANQGESPRAMCEATIPVWSYAVIISMTVLLVLVLVYWAMSQWNRKARREIFVNRDKIVIFVLLSLLISIILMAGEIIIIEKMGVEGKQEFVPPLEENSEKDTKAEDVERGEELNAKNIQLEQYDSNITLTESGEYTISGEFTHALLVNADGPVKLILDNVSINNSTTAAIANISANDLTIELKEGTSNTLSDGGSSEYDACVYSAGKLIIQGDGSLTVAGNQEEGEGIATEAQDMVIDGGKLHITAVDDGINAGGDGGTITINDGEIFIKAGGDGIDSNQDLVINGGNIYAIGSSIGGDAGIDTDEGFVINGGEVIALGSDMLEKPQGDSRQYSISLTLNDRIDAGAKIELKDSQNQVVMSFESQEAFRTIILSSSKIIAGQYTLEADGKTVAINGKTTIEVAK